MKGICFIEPLVAATVKGYKTQTRRLGKPRFTVGEMVFLKEPYKAEYIDITASRGRFQLSYKFGGDDRFVYADTDEIGYGDYERIRASMAKGKSGFANKLFMYGWAARHFIEIIGVRSELLQGITDEDCFKEGIMFTDYGGNIVGVYGISVGPFFTELGSTPREAYAALIDKINGCGTWDANPTVTVYDYKLK